MARRMRTSKAGLDLIMAFEGFRGRSEPLEDGGHIIGFGHTELAKEHQKITENSELLLIDMLSQFRALIPEANAPGNHN